MRLHEFKEPAAVTECTVYGSARRDLSPGEEGVGTARQGCQVHIENDVFHMT
jgi:hypothetical protein